MNKLNEMIAKLCPEGVEWRKLGEVCERLRGTPITAAKMKEITQPNGNIKIFAGGKTEINTFEENIPNANITRVPAVLVQSRGVIDFIYYDKPFTFKNEMWAYTCDNVITVKYLYYILKNNTQKFRDEASKMGSLPQISLRVTDNFLLPLPPLAIQQAIVGILDTFDALEALLEAEKTAREKQYAYYRDKLLTFESGVEWRKLGEVCEVLTGGEPPKDVIKEKFPQGEYKYPIYSNGIGTNAIWGYSTTYRIEKTAVTFSSIGTIGHPTLREGKFTPIIRLKTLIPKDKKVLDVRFLKYSLETIEFEQQKSSVPNINSKMVKDLLLPLPPLAEQERLVAILDKFDALTHDITHGLPAEIEMRKKQYAYYRDKLLTFKQKSPET